MGFLAGVEARSAVGDGARKDPEEAIVTGRMPVGKSAEFWGIRVDRG